MAFLPDVLERLRKGWLRSELEDLHKYALNWNDIKVCNADEDPIEDECVGWVDDVN